MALASPAKPAGHRGSQPPRTIANGFIPTTPTGNGGGFSLGGRRDVPGRRGCVGNPVARFRGAGIARGLSGACQRAWRAVPALRVRGESGGVLSQGGHCPRLWGRRGFGGLAATGRRQWLHPENPHWKRWGFFFGRPVPGARGAWLPGAWWREWRCGACFRDARTTGGHVESRARFPVSPFGAPSLPVIPTAPSMLPMQKGLGRGGEGKKRRVALYVRGRLCRRSRRGNTGSQTEGRYPT